MFRLLFIFISFVFYSSVGFSQTLEIDMLNKLGKEKMLYSVKVAKIDVNQKIIWRSKTKGHNVEFIGMPEGVKKFKSKINKDVENAELASTRVLYDDFYKYFIEKCRVGSKKAGYIQHLVNSKIEKDHMLKKKMLKKTNHKLSQINEVLRS